MHVTLRVRDDLPSLRRDVALVTTWRALLDSARREGFRLVHFCIQSNHLHLVVEASSWRHLTRGLHALSIRLAKRLNSALGRRGPVLAERYHARLLRTPTEVRNVLCYVLNNSRRHHRCGRQPRTNWIDPLSSARWFDGWRHGPRQAPKRNPLPRARTFLLARGWRRGRGGLIATNEVPGSHKRE